MKTLQIFVLSCTVLVGRPGSLERCGERAADHIASSILPQVGQSFFGGHSLPQPHSLGLPLPRHLRCSRQQETTVACLQDSGRVVIRREADDTYEILLHETAMRFLPVRAGHCWIGTDVRQLDTIVVESHNPAFKLEESPQHEIEIAYDFWISETEVSNAQYKAFLRHSCRDTSCMDGLPPDLPVVGVSWPEAVAFCRWLSAQVSGFLIRLPHEVEWEYAAKGNSKRKYPWEGNSITDSLANFGNLHGGLLSVFSHPGGRSAWGALNMAGNAYEWCLNAPYSYPTNPAQLRPELDIDTSFSEQRAVRGGAFLNNAFECRASARHFLTCESKNRHVGFRVLMVRLPEK